MYMKNNKTNHKACGSTFSRLLLMLALLLTGQTLFAQSKQVTGVVKDATGETVIGASVLEKGTPTV